MAQNLHTGVQRRKEEREVELALKKAERMRADQIYADMLAINESAA